MKTQDFSINGTQLTRNRFAQSAENYINSYAFIQMSASESGRGKVSSGYTLYIPVANCLIFLRDIAPETNFKKLILEKIRDDLQYLNQERKWLKKPDVTRLKGNLNKLKWVYLNWDTPKINKPVIKDFPDVTSQWLDYIKDRYPVLLGLEE
jgi:hypothetical protein